MSPLRMARMPPKSRPSQRRPSGAAAMPSMSGSPLAALTAAETAANTEDVHIAAVYKADGSVTMAIPTQPTSGAQALSITLEPLPSDGSTPDGPRMLTSV